MTLYKKLAGLIAGAAMALSLGGCIAVQLNPADVVQEDLIGSVALKFRLCANDASGTAHTGCSETTNGAGADDTATGHALVAIRVPAGTQAPDSFSGTTNDAEPAQVVFNHSPSYQAELERLVPAGAGLEWIGYRSTVYDYRANPTGFSAARTLVVEALRLGLPRTATGAPFASPFRYQVVAGAQKVDASKPADRAVDCGGDAFTAADDDSTICIDSPYKADIGAIISKPVTDVGIVPGRATLSPGQKVDLPFDARINNGPALPDGTTFAASAATSIPGVAVKPNVASFSPPTRIKVPVAIPKGAGPGTFDVAVTARLPNGQSRTGVAKVTVRDRQKPKLTKVKIRPRRFKPSRQAHAGANVAYVVSEAATVRGVVQRCVAARAGRCVRFKTLKGTLARKSAAGRHALHVTGYLRGKRLAPGDYRLVLRPIDLVGNRGKVVRVAFAIAK